MQTQGPFPESLKRAEEMLTILEDSPYAIWPRSSAKMTPTDGYLVLGGDGKSLRFRVDAEKPVITMILARWLDALAQNVEYIMGIREGDGSRFFDCGIHCDILWKAEAESISRGYSNVWNIYRENFITI